MDKDRKLSELIFLFSQILLIIPSADILNGHSKGILKIAGPPDLA